MWSIAPDSSGRRLSVIEQSLPGELSEHDEVEAERRGLPDGCIHDGSEWALLIESKAAAKVSIDQLKWHRRTAARRGFRGCRVLLISIGDPPARFPDWVTILRWSEVYSWLRREQPKSSWAAFAADYLEVAEMRGSADGYLKEGTLTKFAGVPFGPDNPYTYTQAKRVLGLLRGELLKDRRLHRMLNADPESEGRGAITGSRGNSVWDFISLKTRRRAAVFTQAPRLTIGVHETFLGVSVTIPNGIRPRFRTRMLGPQFEDFEALIAQVTRELLRVHRRVKGVKPMITVVQRRYLTQRSKPIHDCILQFDPRTALSKPDKLRGGVKAQPQWLRVTYDALRSRRSNLQFQIGAEFPYESCKVVRDSRIVQVVADTWIACKPLIKAASE